MEGSLFCSKDLIAFTNFNSGVSAADSFIKWLNGLGTAFFLFFRSASISPFSGLSSVTNSFYNVSLSKENAQKRGLIKQYKIH